MRNANPQNRFSPVEIKHIVISMVVLSLAFAILMRNNGFITTFFKHYLNDMWFVGMFGAMFVLVIFSFLLHELGHKFTAQNLGYWSEYRMSLEGLGLAVVMSFVGFLFAAPGAVCIYGNVHPSDNGKISIAGPIVNIVLAAIGLAGCLAFNGEPMVVLFYLLFSLNASLAVFNMLPFGPLDGKKIMEWNIVIWLVFIVIAAVEFIIVFTDQLGLFYRL
ncbi:MAG: Zn-dependent protease [archaeon]|nr:Zn-dependent protease [archaeon]